MGVWAGIILLSSPRSRSNRYTRGLVSWIFIPNLYSPELPRVSFHVSWLDPADSFGGSSLTCGVKWCVSTAWGVTGLYRGGSVSLWTWSSGSLVGRSVSGSTWLSVLHWHYGAEHVTLPCLHWSAVINKLVRLFHDIFLKNDASEIME